MNQNVIPSNLDTTLAQSIFFSGMSQLEFNAIRVFLEPGFVKKGDTLFSENEKAEAMYILISGTLSAFVKQSDGTSQWMFNIGPGEFFGEMSIIANEPRSATIIAKEDSCFMIFQGVDFYRIIFDHPVIAVKMLKAIGSVQNVWLNQSASHLNDLIRWGETARRRAIFDELTGLYNRNFLNESLQDRFERGSIGLRKLSLLMMDLDRVHEVNEKFGMSAGDLVIIAAAKVIKENLRNGDIAARLSGDEYAVILPDTDIEEAQRIAESIRKAVNEKKVIVPTNPRSSDFEELSICISVGIAVAPIHAADRETLFEKSDEALRKAKDLGRDRVEVAG
ncbi:MAG: GGDEF domain-containing protein [Treponema sp.]|jgi:diguanylate cyclase (GGDEF)-like protein|nr:GGDEF domain-containing protein [Treponema sp.]